MTPQIPKVNGNKPNTNINNNLPTLYLARGHRRLNKSASAHEVRLKVDSPTIPLDDREQTTETYRRPVTN